MIWREKRILLLVLAALLLGNVVFFLTYRVQYQSRLDEMDARLAQAQGRLDQTRRSYAQAQAQMQSYKNVERDVTLVFDEHWSTRPRRLTLLIAEVKRLADASNAIPRSYSYGENENVKLEESRSGRGRNVAIGANEVTINYSVTASYDQIRRMINLLELSQQFVIIEALTLSAADQNRLNLTLQLKTLFRDEEPPAAAKRL